MKRKDMEELNSFVSELATHKFFYIPLFSGMPDRETIISGDDCLNLSIALNTADSLDSFLEMV